VGKQIEARICICFAACKAYRESEWTLLDVKTNNSPDKAIYIAKTIQYICLTLMKSFRRPYFFPENKRNSLYFLKMFFKVKH
jgi:hypothetical protein